MLCEKRLSYPNDLPQASKFGYNGYYDEDDFVIQIDLSTVISGVGINKNVSSAHLSYVTVRGTSIKRHACIYDAIPLQR
jgi:hypothetical protein